MTRRSQCSEYAYRDDKLEAMRCPTIALIHGFCLGGGLELALACRFRICREDSKLGFPEVMLGLHPGLAGTWRSLRLMDPVEAMIQHLDDAATPSSSSAACARCAPSATGA